MTRGEGEAITLPTGTSTKLETDRSPFKLTSSVLTFRAMNHEQNCTHLRDKRLHWGVNPI